MFQKSVLGKLAVTLGLVAAAAGLAFASAGHGSSVTPDQALQKLMDGNKHYVEHHMTGALLSDAATRKSLARSQKPYAIILSCSDSRVPPEVIFDRGLGEIFVIRVAGNITDQAVLGSIEYAAEHLGSPLVMVLGHARCGAVTATVDSKGKTTGSPNIDVLVKSIDSATEAASKDCAVCKDDKKCAEHKKEDFVECLVDANVRKVVADLTKESPILKHLVAEKKLNIVAAKYDLDDGTVSLLK